MIVRELITRLGYAVNDTQLRRYQTATNNIRNMADGAADSFRNMFLAFAGFSAIRSIAKVADEMQSLEARIGQLPQTVTTAGEAFDVIASKATDARQGVDAYASFYVKAANATQDYLKTQDEVLKVVDGVSFGLAASGSNAVSQGQALFQLGQAIGSPVAQMEELNTLIDVAPDLFRALGKAIPGANGNLKAFVSTGKVTGEMLARGLMAVLPQFEQQFRQMPITIGQATTVIGNRWKVFINRLNRESGAVTSIANFFLDGFDAIEVGLAKMVAFFGGATQTLKFFGIALAAALAPMLIRNAAGAITFFLTPAGLMFAALVALGLAIEDFYNWMKGGKSVFGQWFGNFDTAMAKLEKYSGWITAVKIAVASAVGVMVANWIWAAGVATYTAGQAALAWVTQMARFGVALAANSVAIGAWVVRLLASVAVMAAGWIASFVSMAIAAAPVILTIVAIVAAVALIIGAIYFLLDNWKLVFSLLKNIATLNFGGIADDFSAMIDKLKGYWNSFKSFFGMGVTTTVGATGTKPNAMAPSTVAGAAASPNGVPVTNTNNAPMTFTVNQTLPPGTPKETADAARGAIDKAFDTMPLDRFSRQLGQVGG